MKPILASTRNGLELTYELEPEWVSVGYGGPTPHGPFEATVAVGYDSQQLPFVKAFLATRNREEAPVIALFEDTVQFSFSASPVSPECMALVRQVSPLLQTFDGLDTVRISSAADTFPDDEEYRIFMELYEQNRKISLVLMETAVFSSHVGGGIPFEIFTVTDLKREFQGVV